MSDTPIPLRTDMSPSLKGSWFREIYNESLGDFAEGKSIIAHGAAALDVMYVALGAVIDAHRAAAAAVVPPDPIVLGKNPGETKSEAAHRVLLATAPPPKLALNPHHENALKRHMQSAFNKVAPKVDANLNRMREARKVLEGKLERAIDADHSSHSDSTRHFLTRNDDGGPAKKGAAYTKAIGLLGKAGEREVRAIAGALIGVPKFLTGIDDRQESQIRAAVARRLAPKEFAAVESAGKAIAAVEQARQIFVAEYTKRLPKGSSKVSAADTALERLAAVD